MSNYVISIGGSGSRSVESLIHLCAAGLGPKELNIIFIDPDKSNGNLTKAQEVLTEYSNTRNMLLDKGLKLEPGDFYYTDFVKTSNNHWGIFGKDNNTLEKYIDFTSLTQPEKDYIKTLYTKEELETPLDEGFRGHPSIGALVMSLVDFDEEPWKSFWGKVNSLPHERSTKVFIFGSIFGGTGAAGLPTISKIIKDKTKIEEGKWKVDLGGALLLPYFTFEPPKEGAKGMFVTINEFPLAAKAALKYYSSLDDTSFDDIYLLGETTENSLGEFSTGTSTQKNRSHYLEMISALSSLDFFNHEKSVADRQRRVFLSARLDNNRITWDELPYSREENRQNQKFNHKLVLTNIKKFMTFLYVKEKYIGEVVFNELRTIRNYKTTWYKNIFDDKVSLKKDDNIHPSVTSGLSQLIKYRALFVRWCEEINQNNGKINVELFDNQAQQEDWEQDSIGRLIPNSIGRTKLNFVNDLVSVSKESKDVVTRTNEPFFRLYTLTEQTTKKFLS